MGYMQNKLIFWKRLAHLWSLVSKSVLEPLPHSYLWTIVRSYHLSGFVHKVGSFLLLVPDIYPSRSRTLHNQGRSRGDQRGVETMERRVHPPQVLRKKCKNLQSGASLPPLTSCPITSHGTSSSWLHMYLFLLQREFPGRFSLPHQPSCPSFSDSSAIQNRAGVRADALGVVRGAGQHNSGDGHSRGSHSPEACDRPSAPGRWANQGPQTLTTHTCNGAHEHVHTHSHGHAFPILLCFPHRKILCQHTFKIRRDFQSLGPMLLPVPWGIAPRTSAFSVTCNSESTSKLRTKHCDCSAGHLSWMLVGFLPGRAPLACITRLIL